MSGALLLLAAGAVAGVVGTAGGITSLVSYPALLAVGLAPQAADVANLVALVACWPGSALSSRRELTGAGRWMAWVLPLAAAGAAGGAALLVTTPPGLFSRVVPYLVAAGSATLLLQPALTARIGSQRRRARTVTLVPLVAVLSIYSGYFGAGAGPLFLAVLLVLVDDRLPESNARKNMLNGACTVTAAVVLVAAGPVAWGAVAPTAVGMFAGSTVGPVLARRLPAKAIRWAVAALGLVLAVRLAVAPG